MFSGKLETGEVLSDLSSGALPDEAGANCADIDGAQGVKALFRPDRYHVSELAPLVPRVEVTSEDGSKHTCRLLNISYNGVAVIWPGTVPVSPEDNLPRISVSFNEYSSYCGAGKVRSVRSVDSQLTVGIHFVDALPNIDYIFHLRDVLNWKDEKGEGLVNKSPAWHLGGYETFKSLVGELRLFLEDADERMARLETVLPDYVVNGAQVTPGRMALLDRIQKEFSPVFLKYIDDISDSLRDVPKEEQHHLKEFSLRHLHKLFMRAPLLHKSREKLLGYPGDYQVMLQMYEQKFEGACLFDKVLHVASNMAAAPQGVRGRKNLVKQILQKVILGWDKPRPIRIASIAAGPVREILELIRELDPPGNRIEFVLFDQDKLALSYAQSQITRSERARWPRSLKVTYLHSAIKRLMDVPIFEGGKFDVIFCTGLFDYLRRATAVGLSRFFYSGLLEGGCAYIGNMVPDTTCRWVLEYHLEWFLVYRSRQELLDIGRLAVPTAELEIMEEESGFNPLLRMRKC